MINLGSPGGQAGTSSKIENYLGFPHRVSGLDLAFARFTQAVKFGTRICPIPVKAHETPTPVYDYVIRFAGRAS